MSDIFFKCRVCGKYLVVDDEGAGLTVDCPDCRASISIPDLLLVHECPHCKQIVKAACEMTGELVLCRSCQTEVRLPGNPQLVGK
jgi:phage FluMu protein Com